MTKRPPIRVAVDPPLFREDDTFIVEFEVGNDTGIMTCHNLTLAELRDLSTRTIAALEPYTETA